MLCRKISDSFIRGTVALTSRTDLNILNPVNRWNPGSVFQTHNTLPAHPSGFQNPYYLSTRWSVCLPLDLPATCRTASTTLPHTSRSASPTPYSPPTPNRFHQPILPFYPPIGFPIPVSHPPPPQPIGYPIPFHSPPTHWLTQRHIHPSSLPHHLHPHIRKSNTQNSSLCHPPASFLSRELSSHHLISLLSPIPPSHPPKGLPNHVVTSHLLIGFPSTILFSLPLD